MYEPIVTYLGGLLTAIVIFYLNDRSNTKQGRNTRLSDYEAFLLDWEQRIERSSGPDLYNSYFKEGAAEFRSRAARVRRDFPDRAEFNRLDEALSRLRPQDLANDPAFTKTRDRLADAIRPLIRYVQSA